MKPYGSRKIQPQKNNSVLVLEHENGEIHIRAFFGLGPYVLKVLTSRGFRPNLTLENTFLGNEDFSPSQTISNNPSYYEAIFVKEMWFEPGEVSLEKLMKIFLSISVNAHGYRAVYRQNGPLVQYERVGGPSKWEHYPIIHSISYGFNSGTHYFGSDLLLRTVVDNMMFMPGDELCLVKDKQGRLDSFSVRSGSPGEVGIAKLLEAYGITCLIDSWIPSED